MYVGPQKSDLLLRRYKETDKTTVINVLIGKMNFNYSVKFTIS